MQTDDGLKTGEDSRSGFEVARVLFTLEDHLVFSRRQATTGEHETLDCIPGSALLGWAAGQLYSRLDPGTAWRLFHGGAVRFGVGRPYTALGERAWPVPLSWHVNKGDVADPVLAPAAAPLWNTNSIYNLAAPDALPPGAVPPGVQAWQPRGLRSGYVDRFGSAPAVQRHYRLMTAIGDAGVAAEGQLFGYQSLVRGQRFAADIALSLDLPQTLRDDVLGLFDGRLRLGRSKATQYGRVSGSVQRGGGLGSTPSDSGSASSEALDRPSASVVTLWLLSDAELMTPAGDATLRPDLSHLLGPAAGAALANASALRWVPERSFVRNRRYSAWNAWRASHSAEHHVLCAGSVITLATVDGSAVPPELRLALAQGVGVQRESGLGEVLVDPPLLRGLKPVFDVRPTQAPEPEAVAKPVADVSESQSPLLKALRARAGRDQQADDGKAYAAGWLWGFINHLERSRQYLGTPPTVALGPSRTQWGQMAAHGRQAVNVNGLKGLVLTTLGVKEDGPVTDAAWKAPHHPERSGTQRCLGDIVRCALDALDAPNGGRFGGRDADALDVWQRLCSDAGRMGLSDNAGNLKRALQQIDRSLTPEASQCPERTQETH